MRLGVDCELAPVPSSVLRHLSLPAPDGAGIREARTTPGSRADLPQRLADSPAAQELRCLLDTQPTEPGAWLARVDAAISAAFGEKPSLLAPARYGLAAARPAVEAGKAGARDAALAELDALLFALTEAGR